MSLFRWCGNDLGGDFGDALERLFSSEGPEADIVSDPVRR
jgi:hypothetical protein